MKAAVVTQAYGLEIWDVPMPQIGDYDVLCRLEYGATCGGTDLRLMRGEHPNPVTYPGILGHESVGRVVEIGAKVKNFHCGDLVTRVGAPAGLLDGLGTIWGGFAEYGIAKDHWQMRRDGLERSQWDRNRVNQVVPPGIDSKTAPMMITWRETFSYARRIGVREGQRILVVGSGANALALAVHACNIGAEVWVVGSPAKEMIFRRYPIQLYFSYQDEALVEKFRAFGPKQVDMILDGVGAMDVVNKLLFCLRRYGTVGIYGWNDRGKRGIDVFSAGNSILLYADGYDEEEAHGEVSAMILQGRLRAEDWYDTAHPVALEDIAAAYQNLKQHKALKYLIRLS